MSSHRHHHRHSVWYRIRRWFRHNKKQMIGSILIGGAAVLVTGLFFYRSQQSQQEHHVTAGNSVDMKNSYRTISVDGKEYQYNSLITTVLFAGLDSEGDMEATASYSNKARADSIALVVLDKKNEKMSIIALNRDTMTQIRRYTRSGSDMGTYKSHLGYAYSYGNGGDVSCENLKEAVESLLNGIPVNEYVVTNRSSMTEINNLVGGVTLTVPNNDLEEKYPQLKEGAQITLDDTNIEAYLRYRDTSKEFSNEGRIERQQTYITAYVTQLKELLKKDTSEVWNKTLEMEKHLQTSITRNKYLKLAKLLEQTSFNDTNYYRPQGTDQQGELHDEFYLDEDAFRSLLLDLFYEEV